MNETFRSRLNRFQVVSLAMGIVGLLLCGVGARSHAAQFFVSYLFGWMFWLGLAMGCLGVAMIHHLTGGRWGQPTRRFLEAGFMTLPLMAVLVVPLFFGLQHLYPWARTADVAANPALQHRAIYLNHTAFIARAICCFLIWTTLAVCLRKWSLDQDETTSVIPTRRMRALSGAGIIIYPLTMTIAAVDWVMSLEPDWYSTMFPVIICIGQILTAYAFVIVLAARFKNCPPVSAAITCDTFLHLGNLLLAFVIFWTYVMFGQFLIIWSGNLAQEIEWYRHRSGGTWSWVIVFLAVFHFFLPFFVLLFRSSKRRAGSLAILAAMVFVARIVDVFWMIAPTISPAGFRVNWLDFAAFIGIGGVWSACFIAFLKRAPLVPQNVLQLQPDFAYAK